MKPWNGLPSVSYHHPTIGNSESETRFMGVFQTYVIKMGFNVEITVLKCPHIKPRVVSIIHPRISI